MNNSPFLFNPIQPVPQVPYYADLPDPTLNYANLYYVQNSSGIWLINRHEYGFYRSSGTEWLYQGETQGSGNPSVQDQVVIMYGRPAAASVYVGAAVYINSSGTAVNADASDYNTSDVLGIVVSKQTTTSADILVSGISPAFYSGLVMGGTYFLASNDPGQLTSSVPQGSGETVLKVGIALSSTELFVAVDSRLMRAV